MAIYIKGHPEGLLDLKEAQQYLGGIGRTTVYSYMNRPPHENRLIKASRPGRKLLFTRRDLDTFIEMEQALAEAA
ncbi:helix-turn-helix domain-containing protein [Corynebacterium sp. c8Ua_181]|uniref:Helix-turn-helix domain-containing protein n=1 Tax=Corynebacterium curieae TaxID=2913500 RepID=A0A9X3MC81_9CORY|nr:helix-turn-helix domain-containing protein [Corynebacterium curieae]MCZ9306985.1 helix-turn-helix domain-containing protein [Corynebacterium curieae]